MLHVRYFCSCNANNFLKSLNPNTNSENEDQTKKRKPTDSPSPTQNKKKPNPAYFKLDENEPETTSAHLQDNIYSKYLRNILSSLITNSNEPTNNPQLAYLSSQFKQNTDSLKLLNTFISNMHNLNRNGLNLAPPSDPINPFQLALNNYKQQCNSQYMSLAQSTGLVKENFSSVLMSYLENQAKLGQAKASFSPANMLDASSSAKYPIRPAIFPTVALVSPKAEFKKENFQGSEPFAPSTTAQMYSPPVSVVKPPSLPDFNALLSSPAAVSLQNWCAKCNTHFRLTSDLVYHMRTFHKKDEVVSSSSTPSSSSRSSKIGLDSIKPSCFEPKLHGSDRYEPSMPRESKYLKCEICNEVFKEKHHLSRHMTSHR
jgi:hypothetical protein